VGGVLVEKLKDPGTGFRQDADVFLRYLEALAAGLGS
jgi:hypothetical protein